MTALVAVSVYYGAKPEELGSVFAYFMVATVFFLFYPLIQFVGVFFDTLVSTKEKSPFRWLALLFRNFDASLTGYVSRGHIGYGIAAILAILPLTISFCVGKSLIPHLADYVWDPLLSSADRIIHFGYYPHELLAPLMKSDLVNIFMDMTYLSWFIMLYLVQGYCFFSDRDLRRRMRFLWSVVLGWSFMGTLLAALLASVGPIFYGDFYQGVNPYADFIALLENRSQELGLHVFTVAEALQEMVSNETVIDMNAISAMPSMHVAFAWLAVIYSWNINRKIWVLALAYYFIILTGSVYLGWHYAVDGYVGTLLIWVIWRLSGVIVDRLHPELALVKG